MELIKVGDVFASNDDRYHVVVLGVSNDTYEEKCITFKLFNSNEEMYKLTLSDGWFDRNIVTRYKKLTEKEIMIWQLKRG